MPWRLHTEVSGAVSVSKRFEPAIEGRLQASIVVGDDLSPEEIAAIPGEIYIGRPNAKVLADVIGWSIGPHLLSPRLRALIELLDPGVHTFKPVSVRTEGEFFGRREHGDYHLLITPPRIDAVVVDETDFSHEMIRGQAGYDYSLVQSTQALGVGSVHFSTRAGAQRVLSAASLGNRNLWRLPKTYHSRLMCSDKLKSEMKDRKMRGWSFDDYFEAR